jgi:hypothetical protein
MQTDSKKAGKKHTENNHENPSLEIRSLRPTRTLPSIPCIPFISYLHSISSHPSPPLSSTLGIVIPETPGVAHNTSRIIRQESLWTAEQPCNDCIDTASAQGIFTDLLGCKTGRTAEDDETENQTHNHHFLWTLFYEFFHLETSFRCIPKQDLYQHGTPQMSYHIDKKENTENIRESPVSRKRRSQTCFKIARYAESTIWKD